MIVGAYYSLTRGPWWRRHGRKVRWAAGLWLAYTVLGFLVFPPILKWVAIRQISGLLERPVAIESLRLNPYVFSITIRGFRIGEKPGAPVDGAGGGTGEATGGATGEATRGGGAGGADGSRDEPFLAWEEVYVNVQPTSVFARAWAVREFRIVQPFARAQMNRDGTFNFSDLIAKFSKPSDGGASGSAGGGAIPALRVDQLDIVGARVSVADLTPRTPFRRVLGPVQISLNQFRTHPDNKNPYSFTGTTDSGERFSWSGHFFLGPVRSDGELTLENLVLAKYAPLYQDLVKFDLEEGVVDVRARYRVELGVTTNLLAVTDSSVRLRDLRVKERGTGESVVSLPEFQMTGGRVDATARRAMVESVRVREPSLQVRRTKDAAINVLELAKPPETATNVAGGVRFLLQSVTNVFAMLWQTTNHWQATLGALEVQDASVRLDDRVNSRPVELVADDIDVTVRNASNLPGTNITAEVAVRWNTNGTVRLGATASLFPPKADLNLQLAHLELRPLDPYLEPFVDVLILRSRLGMDARIGVRQDGTNPLPAVSFQGDLSLEDMGAAGSRTGEDLVRWKSLRFSGLEAELEPARVKARELSVEDLFAHVVIETNGQINLLAAARMGNTNLTAGSGVSAPLPAGGKPEARPAPKGRPGLAIPTNGVTLALAIPVTIDVGALTFTNGVLQFTDRTARPAVDATVQGLAGAVRGISTDPAVAAELEVRGVVERTGPVRISGRLYPAAPVRETRVEVGMTGVDLLPTSPYVGRFLGYRLSKGKLGVDVRYDVREGRVRGTNLIRLDQFTLGEKVESPDALALPVKLGIAILKDRNGRIELDVPVEGSLSDPEFKLGRVITRTLVNILTKIVTSPFSALGAVFGGGGEELSYQEFGPGSDELSAAARSKLDKVVSGLFERPGLNVEIEGAVDVAVDGTALRRAKLEAAYRLAKWQDLGKSARSQTSPDKLVVTPEEFARYLEKRHRAEFSPAAIAARAAAAGAAPGTVKAPTNAPPAGSGPGTAGGGASLRADERKGAIALRTDRKGLAPKVAPDTMADQVIALVPLDDADFAKLAAGRARRVRDYLLQSGKVEPARILMSEPAAASKASKGARVFLKLE